MRKLLLCMVLLLSVALVGCGDGGEQAAQKDQDQVKLGIIQLVEHPALDAAREGFLDVLKENGYTEGDNLVLDTQIAQNDQANLQTISRKFVQDQCDLVLAIATPAAMTMANETSEIPILITAVTDPVSAKLVNSMEQPGTNVTGTSDLNPIKDQLQLIKDLAPNTKKVGMIFNSSEINSKVQADLADKIAPELGLELVKVTVTASSEVMQAAQSLVGRVDAIYLPTDNMVITSLAAVMKVAEENKLPVVVGEVNALKSGGLATVGIEYYQLGRTTGEMALEILSGKNPAEMPIKMQPGSDIVISKKAAERIGLEISPELQAKAKLID